MMKERILTAPASSAYTHKMSNVFVGILLKRSQLLLFHYLLLHNAHSAKHNVLVTVRHSAYIVG